MRNVKAKIIHLVQTSFSQLKLSTKHFASFFRVRFLKLFFFAHGTRLPAITDASTHLHEILCPRPSVRPSVNDASVVLVINNGN